MSVQLRCQNRIMFGDLDHEDGVLEVKCRSTRCGAGPGKVILHRFSILTGDLLETKVYRDPNKPRKGVESDDRSPIRSA